jgi:hypothetical protein
MLHVPFGCPSMVSVERFIERIDLKAITVSAVISAPFVFKPQTSKCSAALNFKGKDR